MIRTGKASLTGGTPHCERSRRTTSHPAPAATRLPVYSTVVAFDICGFGDPRRTHEDQIYLCERLYGAVTDAFKEAGLILRDLYCEDRGDGILIVVPAEVPTVLLFKPLVGWLRDLLQLHNRHASDLALLRVRMALHAGHVSRHRNGVTGVALVHLSRLLEAPDFKHDMQASSATLGLIVSDYLYEEVVLQQIGQEAPDAYHPIDVRLKETAGRAWVTLSTDIRISGRQSLPQQTQPPGTRVRNAG